MINKITWILLFSVFAFQQKGMGQTLVQGKITDGKEAIPFATVFITELQKGVSSDENGFFSIPFLPKGEYQLQISAMGYRSRMVEWQINDQDTIALGPIILVEDVLGIEEVVVTGIMKEAFTTASPIKVEVITAKYMINNIAPTNLVEGISLINGVQEVVECGVCYTNSISINGLPGAYTAVLMDGSPMFGNLAAVYSLNGIPTMIIDRIEVIKGPSSTLYGSEAVAGVINIITKDPTEQPDCAFDLMATTHNEWYLNGAWTPKVKDWDGYIGLNFGYINSFHDDNEDLFGDVANLDRISLFSKWSMDRPENKRVTIAAKYYYEDRRNGVETYLQDRGYQRYRGSGSIYGESIYTQRLEVFGTYELAGKEIFKLDYSFSHHDQDSYYGADFYEARQRIAYANFTWNKPMANHDLLMGLTSRYQFYDDNTIATQTESFNQPDHQFIPGIFFQDEWSIGKNWTLLTGLRIDHYQAHGFIGAPRLNVKYKPTIWTSLRGNFGTGFRLVNLFTEDHAFVTGQRTVEIREDLKPERSYNVAFNWNQVYTLGNSQGTFDVDAFYTHFTNKILPDYDTPGMIIYENIGGYALSKGIGLSTSHQFMFPLAINVSVNWQDVKEAELLPDGNFIKRKVEFAPNWTAVSTFNYRWKKAGLNLAYTLQMTGPMALPEVYDLDAAGNPLLHSRSTQSPAFAFHNLQLTKTFKKSAWEVYTGLQNLANYTQEISPLAGVRDPNFAPGFSPYFDTSYAFGPIHGRELYLGLRWNSGK